MRLFEGWSEAIAAAGLEQWRGGRQSHWTDARIERELRAFLAGRDSFRNAAFRATGQRAPWEALRRRGGRERWAERLGLAPEPSPEGPSAWRRRADRARAAPAHRRRHGVPDTR